MKLHFFIGCCFLLILLLGVVPHREVSNETTIYYYNSLPRLFSFSVFCLAILALAVVIRIRVLNKKLVGGYILRQGNGVNKENLYTIISFSLIALFARSFTSYFLLSLIAISIYLYISKLIIKRTNPGVLAINNGSIFFKSHFRIKEIKIASLIRLDYNPRQKTLKLKFSEGLDEISLPLSDFHVEHLETMIAELIHNRKQKIALSDKFTAFFGNIDSGGPGFIPALQYEAPL